MIVRSKLRDRRKAIGCADTGRWAFWLELGELKMTVIRLSGSGQAGATSDSSRRPPCEHPAFGRRFFWREGKPWQ